MTGALEALGAALLRASLEGAAAVALVGLVVALLPRLPASVRCFLWWAACARFLVALPGWGVAVLPALPAGWSPAATAVESSAPPLSVAAQVPQLLGSVEPSAMPLPAADPRHLGPVESTAASPPAAAASARQRRIFEPADALLARLTSLGRGFAQVAAVALPWLAAFWLAGIAVAFLRLGRALRRLRRLLAGARPVTEGRLAATLVALCRRLRLRPPGLLASTAVRSPLVVGPARPRVLLPEAGLAEMSAAEAEMVLCHELAHLRRRDLWLGWLPSLARTIFFFHPLAALAAREYALAREAACDAEVLCVLGSAPRDYGRLLLRWGLAPRESGLAAAAAAPSRHHLKRRLLMLDRHDPAPRRRALLWAAPAAVALLALLPLRLVATEGEAAMLDPSLFTALPSQLAWSGDQAPDPPEPPPRPIDTPAPALPAPPPATAEPHPPASPAPRPTPSGTAPQAPPASQGVPRTPAPQSPPAIATPAAPSVAPAPAPAPSPDVRVPPGAAPPAPAAAPRPVATPAPFAPPARPGAVGSPPAAPPSPPAPSGRAVAAVAGSGSGSSGLGAPAVPAAAPHPSDAPRAQGAAAAPQAGSRHTSTYSFGNSERGAWVFVEGEARTMSGSSGDAERALAARRGDEPLLYVRRGGDAWVVRDPALLAEAKSILEPVLELGRQQGELGGRQGALGGEQGGLGERQGALGAEQGKLGSEQGRLSAELARLSAELADVEARRRQAAESERPALAARRQEIRERMDGLEERIAALGRQQRELGERQRALGAEQRALGERQRELGDRQRQLGERQRAASAAAEEGLAALIDRARAAGKAEAVR